MKREYFLVTLAPAPPLKEGAEKRFFMKVSKGKRVDFLQSAFSRRFVELVVTRTVSQSVRVGTKDAVYKNRLHYIRFSNYNGSFRRGHWLKLELKLT